MKKTRSKKSRDTVPLSTTTPPPVPPPHRPLRVATTNKKQQLEANKQSCLWLAKSHSGVQRRTLSFIKVFHHLVLEIVLLYILHRLDLKKGQKGREAEATITPTETTMYIVVFTFSFITAQYFIPHLLGMKRHPYLWIGPLNTVRKIKLTVFLSINTVYAHFMSSVFEKFVLKTLKKLYNPCEVNVFFFFLLMGLDKWIFSHCLRNALL